MKPVACALVLCFCSGATAQERWERLAPFFRPPPAWAGKLGEYRSPLLFQDGRPVLTPGDWPARRAEILADWHRLMGPWPELIARPELKVLKAAPRGQPQRVEVEIAPGHLTRGYLIVPEGEGPFPAVVVPYYEPETSIGRGNQPLRDFGSQLARRGFVTLSIGSPGGDARQPELAGARCQPLSFLGVVAANCLNALATLPEVDPNRIGITGHSYGGKWAMFAACLYERFACAAVSDPGIVFDEERPNVNYWDPWYLGWEPGRARPTGKVSAQNPRTGAYRGLVEGGHDLHELHALMAPRPFLVSGGSEDGPERWVALNHAVAVNRLLGYSDRVGMTNRPGHTPTEESNEQIYLFFEHFLKHPPATQPSPARDRSP